MLLLVIKYFVLTNGEKLSASTTYENAFQLKANTVNLEQYNLQENEHTLQSRPVHYITLDK